MAREYGAHLYSSTGSTSAALIDCVKFESRRSNFNQTSGSTVNILYGQNLFIAFAHDDPYCIPALVMVMLLQSRARIGNWNIICCCSPQKLRKVLSCTADSVGISIRFFARECSLECVEL
jgi:hypothetical protein